MKQYSFDVFDALLRSIVFEKPTDESNWTKTQITSPNQVQLNAGASVSKVNCVMVWSNPQGKVSIDSLQRATMSWLGSRGLPISDSLANTLLAFAAHLSLEFGGASGFFDELDKLVRQGKAKHVLIVSEMSTATLTKCDFSGYRFGTLRAHELRNHFRQIGSEGFARDLFDHSGKIALESPDLDRWIIDLPSLCARKKGIIEPRLLGQLLEQYFQELSSSHIRLMWNDIESAILIPNALQGGSISLHQISSLPGIPCYTSYAGFGVDHKHGWVGRQHQQPDFRLPSPRLLDELISGFTKSFALHDIESSPLMPLIKNIARSISRGWTHAYSGRVDEAFLFMVISLEQIFSSKIATSQNLARRTAVVCHQELEKPFDEVRRMVSDLYDKRSRIVHDGESPDFDSFSNLQEIATCVLKSLLRYARNGLDAGDVVSDDLHIQWLKVIDFIASAIDAKQSVSEETFRRCGLETTDH